MKNLSKEISELIINEYGEDELLKKLSDPYWFQSFGCVLGFDWHSSGLTTTTTGALKEALKENPAIGIAGGKKLARKAPEEIKSLGERFNFSEQKINELIRISRLSAKVDNALVQDSFNLYHHTIFFTQHSWAVVQQGMKDRYARRYHWINNENLNFVNEPHAGIISDLLTNTLNLTAYESKETRKCSLDLIKDNPTRLKKYIQPLKIHNQRTLFDFNKTAAFSMPSQHFPSINADLKTLLKVYEMQPENYEEMILIKGMGQKNIRALAMISHLVHGTELSWKDPVKFSFAHGGKDGWPYPVDKKVMTENTEFLQQAIVDAKINSVDKVRCLKRLDRFYAPLVRI